MLISIWWRQIALWPFRHSFFFGLSSNQYTRSFFPVIISGLPIKAEWNGMERNKVLCGHFQVEFQHSKSKPAYHVMRFNEIQFSQVSICLTKRNFLFIFLQLFWFDIITSQRTRNFCYFFPQIYAQNIVLLHVINGMWIRSAFISNWF